MRLIVIKKTRGDSETIISVTNSQTPTSSLPGDIELGESSYLSYFENRVGKEYILIGSPEERKVTIITADTKGEQKIEMEWGKLAYGKTIVLYKDEVIWISNCFATMLQMDFFDIYKVMYDIFLSPYYKERSLTAF